MKVRNILATKGGRVITVAPDQAVRQAVALLVENRIGALIVTDADGQLVGILSERDVMYAAADDEGVFGRPVGDIMTQVSTSPTPISSASSANGGLRTRLATVSSSTTFRCAGRRSICC